MEFQAQQQMLLGLNLQVLLMQEIVHQDTKIQLQNYLLMRSYKKMIITSAQYIDSDGNGTNDHIDIVIDDQKIMYQFQNNRHYAEIMRQVVQAGELTIAE